jgi:4-hydroxy-2-oxoheptanedioate aldolase
MRPSKVLAKLRAGGVVNCVKLNLCDARASEIAALCGVDCIWLGVEHVPNTFEHIEQQVRAAKAYDTDTIVRVERGSYSDLIRPLEMDATGIMVPHVMSAADAREVAWRTRFYPVGRRPLDGGNADGAYCGIPVDQYIAEANRERMVIVQIEDPEAMEELDDIASVEGIDMLFYGPGDYSHALGVAGQMDHPEVQAGFTRVAEAARKHGKFAGTVTSLEAIPDRVAQGYQFLSSGADVLALREVFSRVVSAFSEFEGTRG